MEPQIYENETTDLTTHVSLCHLRYQELNKRMGKIENDLDQVKQTVSKGNKQVLIAVISTSGTVFVGLITALLMLLGQ
jgi:uncharacterized membrane protein SpoIIM required for sporulation